MSRLLPTLVALAALTPGAAAGQSLTYGRVLFSTTQTCEDNLFATADGDARASDVISRFGPAVEAGYRSVRLTLDGRYAIDAERYWSHAELSRRVARQDGGLDVRYAPTHRLTLSGGASYMETHTPMELNIASQLARGRAHADRITTRSAASYEWDRTTMLSIDYELTRESLSDLLVSTVHSPRLGVARRLGGRSAYRVDYRFRHLASDVRSIGAGHLVNAAHVVTAGWTQQLARMIDVEIEGGPRVSDGAMNPELLALVRRRARHGEISVRYARSQTTAVGERGLLDVQALTFAAQHAPARRLALRAAPAFIRTTRDGRQVSVRMLDLEAIVQLTQGLSLVTSSRLGRQDGAFYGSPGEIPHRSLGMTLRITLPAVSRALPAGPPDRG